MSDTQVTKFVANPMQKAFIESQAQADFFSTRVGEGKSAALAWSISYHTRHNPGATWAMIRDTWENLRRTTLQEFLTWFPNGHYGTWHETNKEWTWAEGWARGKIVWMGMDDPKDAAKLQSLPLGGAALDEVAPAQGSGGIPELVFDLVLTRMRQPGMNWRPIKLASNNADDSHWTYPRFVDPGTEGFRLWQPQVPENMKNLPSGYYELLRKQLGHRQDLVDRFVEGQFGFQQIGQAVTPQFNPKLHLATGLSPVRGCDLILLWDFGLNPTCVITQVTPLGHWLVLQSFVGEGIGAQELIEGQVKPTLESPKYKLFRWRHIGDPNGLTPEQSSSKNSAVRVVRTILGGTFRGGSPSFSDGVEPLRAVLARTIGGRGVVQVDRSNAGHVYRALRGGWHFGETNAGVINSNPVKDIHSHPGDAMRYGASRLFPMGRLLRAPGRSTQQPATFFGGAPAAQRGPVIPAEMRKILETARF